jgi:hypothetical protein
MIIIEKRVSRYGNERTEKENMKMMNLTIIKNINIIEYECGLFAVDYTTSAIGMTLFCSYNKNEVVKMYNKLCNMTNVEILSYISNK